MIPISDFTTYPDRLKCLQESPEGPFHRQHDATRKPDFPYTSKQACDLRSELILKREVSKDSKIENELSAPKIIQCDHSGSFQPPVDFETQFVF